VTLALMELHWLSAVDHVTFKDDTLVCRCQHDLAPPYLSASLLRLADVESRHWLSASADTDILQIPCSWLVTVGDLSFPVAGTWNNLPETATLLPLFK